VPPPASAQSRSASRRFLIGMAWNVGFPVASVHDFTNAASALGFEFLVRYFALPKLSIGVSTDFQTFIATRPRATYQVDNGAVTATAYNSAQNTALRASAHYYFLKDGPVLPYAGASIGVGWSTFQSAMADLVIYDNQTSVLLGGDVGAVFPLANSSLALMTAFRYSALPSAEFLYVSDVQSLTLQFGVLTL
jgi:opacity protein-like surface antigen